MESGWVVYGPENGYNFSYPHLLRVKGAEGFWGKIQKNLKPLKIYFENKALGVFPYFGGARWVMGMSSSTPESPDDAPRRLFSCKSNALLLLDWNRWRRVVNILIWRNSLVCRLGTRDLFGFMCHWCVTLLVIFHFFLFSSFFLMI